ncbi:unnamed protein product [Paramecium pentaurelia]|uniref:Uncharacterized protein n=1 Tax=Paramecium pentaurelia TaxID=43138 RepID=A0A8S1T9E5_9CILI|nr:unnamed protein product [Paramecium pentaurelia]
MFAVKYSSVQIIFDYFHLQELFPNVFGAIQIYKNLIIHILLPLIEKSMVDFQNAHTELNLFVDDPKIQCYYLINDFDTKSFKEKEKYNSYFQTQEQIDNPVRFIEDEVNQRTENIRQQFIEQYSQKLTENVNNNLNLILSKFSIIKDKTIEKFKSYLVLHLIKKSLRCYQDFTSNRNKIFGRKLNKQMIIEYTFCQILFQDSSLEVKEQNIQLGHLQVSINFIEQQIQKIRYMSNQEMIQMQIKLVIIINEEMSIQQEKPFLYSCEEIQNKFQVQDFNSDDRIQMKQIRNMYQDWDIPQQYDDKNANTKNNVIWSSIDQIIKIIDLEGMEEDLLLMKNKVIFQENYHYVVLLDYSGSMSENRFNRAQIKQFHFYHQHNRIRISSCHHNLQIQSQMCGRLLTYRHANYKHCRSMQWRKYQLLKCLLSSL